MKVFAADVGGTTCRLAIVDITHTPKIVLKEIVETNSTNLSKAVDVFLDKATKKGHKVTTGAFSVAGPPSEKKKRR